MAEKKTTKSHKKNIKTQIATKHLPRKGDFSANNHTASAASRLVLFLFLCTCFCCFARFYFLIVTHSFYSTFCS